MPTPCLPPPRPGLRTVCSGVLALVLATLLPSVQAEERRVVGPVAEIKVAADGKSAQVVVKDGQNGAAVPLLIDDDETLDKFKDQRISEGDEVRVRYETVAGVHRSRFFRRTSGC